MSTDYSTIESIKKQINDITEESKELNKSPDFTFYNFLDAFDIFEIAVGTTIGFILSKILENFANDTIKPFIHGLIENEHVTGINILGIHLDIEKILIDFTYFFVLLIIMYFSFKYIFRNYVGLTINNKLEGQLVQRKTDLTKIELYEEILEELKEIKTSLVNRY